MMMIRLAASEQDIRDAYEIEIAVFAKDAAATLEAFQMRKIMFGTYFLIAETDLDHQIIGVTNGVKLHHMHLTDESIKQGVEFAMDGLYYCLLTIAVHPSYQRQGVATELLKKVIHRAKEDGLKGIVLMCEEHLISFYEQNGFLYAAPSSSSHGGIQWHEMNLIWK